MLLLLPTGWARGQISPGPLSDAHADLDSNLQCLDCHGGGKDTLDRKCLTCHREIRWLKDHRRGLHARAAGDCAGCHPEHAGRDFELIDWPDGNAEAFDHVRAGWPLDGAHGRADCDECHRPQHQHGPVADLLRRTDSQTSWLGLERDCRGCHEDLHRDTLGFDCAACHGADRWKPMVGFDHARATFALAGKHLDLACERCHLVPGRVFMTGVDGTILPRYKPVPHEECSSCHEDVHRGRLGDECGRCHVPQDFRSVSREAFDHGRTRYPLVGRHRSVTCETCHDPDRAWGPRPDFRTCGACHTDAHAGSATLAGRRVDCAACHDERGFDRSTYGVTDHAAASYPLEGRHAGVGCTRCHVKNKTRAELGPAGVLLRPRHDSCRTCHADAHRDQLAARADAGACESCHTIDGFKPSRFTVSEHAGLRLPLEGRHAEVECSTCHGPLRRGLAPLPGPEVLGSARVAFRALDVACASCHHDPHVRRLGDDCRGCHDSRRFRPSIIDASGHDEFDYRLDGAHAAVPCSECHEELTRAAAADSLLLTGDTTRTLTFETRHESCESCHDTPHGDQFAQRDDAEGCAACHDVESFRPASRFDHERDAGFSLGKAHLPVPCEKCHPQRTDREGRMFTVYRPTPRDCRDCHAGGVTPRNGTGAG